MTPLRLAIRGLRAAPVFTITALATLIAAIDQTASLIGDTGATSREPLGRVRPEFFATLGVAPVLGRAFTEAELTYRTDHVAMLSAPASSTRTSPDASGATATPSAAGSIAAPRPARTSRCAPSSASSVR
jgi:hypothetical protein